jgi:putative DNA primase/helicase
MTSSDIQLQVLAAARHWHAAGCSVWPPMQDGTKRPMGKEWKPFMRERAPLDQVELMIYGNSCTGIGLICGAVSGNLEMLELEAEATNSASIDAILSEAQARGVDWLWDLLTQNGYAEWTPSGGLHLLYRVDGEVVPGNTKIARRPATEQELKANPQDKIKTLSETRGEGGYVVVAPSGGTVHPSGESWSLLSGKAGHVPTISWKDRCALHEAIKEALDQMPPVEEFVRPATPRNTLPLDGSRPGDDFMQRGTWEEILEPHGWRVHHRTISETFWTRPGKKRLDGWSASTGLMGTGLDDRLYVWSSSTVFQPERPYNKFAAYTLLEHNGDFSAATRALAARGYGSRDTVTPVPQAVAAQRLLHPTTSSEVTVPAANTPVAVKTWKEVQMAPALFRMFPYTTRGVGDMFAEAYHQVLRYQPEGKRWWFYDGKVWKQDGRDRHDSACLKLLTAMRDEAERRAANGEDYADELRKLVNRMENASAPAASRWGRVDPRLAVEAADFDSTPDVVAVGNGMLNLTTRELVPHDPSFLSTKMLGADFDDGARAPRWEQFLEEALPDPVMRDYTQRAIGHAILGRAERRALFLLHGPSGSGKSQFMRVMELLFGEFGETAAASTFSASSRGASLTNDLNDLKGKRFVGLSELDEDEQFNESLLKRLTGGDTAKSRGLFQENSRWRVQFSLWMATNYLPRLKSDDNALWKRVKPIHFPNVVSESGRAEIVDLAEKIFKEEAAGVLNWVLDGVTLYLERGLDDPEQVSAAVNTYRSEVDEVTQFVNESITDGTLVRGEDEKVRVRQLHGIYAEWCRRNNIRHWLGERRFSRRMEAIGFKRKVVTEGTVFVGVTCGSFGMLGTMNVPLRQ